MARVKTLIMGAAGRDFHNFNVFFRHNPDHEVVAFTANQIPNIDGRAYPAGLAGPLYPQGIPIYPESELDHLIAEQNIREVVLAYSDLSHLEVMHRASRVLALGADFRLMGPRTTMLRAAVPVVAVLAVRTGSGKSQTTRRVTALLREAGKRAVIVRHPMPYGDLAAQACQRFASYADLERHHCTIEEREEYEPLLDLGMVVFAGVDYQCILEDAQREADVIVWDGGNNDMSFYETNLCIVVADPHRAGHEMTYYPGETNLRMADVVVINKVDTSDLASILLVRQHIAMANPQAMVIEAASPILVQDAPDVRGRRVLVIEDGPTLTHGEMAYGAGLVAAQRLGASEIVDPRPYAVGSLAQAFVQYPHIGAVLPAMGYGEVQQRELEATINATPCDLVLVATPIDLGKILHIDRPARRVSYELQEIGRPTLEDALARFL
jgi:predicted GTPase